MLFDLKSGKRRRVVQVVFGFLAFIFFISFVGFGIGSDVSGGLFDAIGLGGDDTGQDAESVYQQQIDDAEKKLAENPKDEKGLTDLARYHFLAGQQANDFDQSTGLSVLTEAGRSQWNEALDAWEKLLKTKPKELDPQVAFSMICAYVPPLPQCQVQAPTDTGINFAGAIETQQRLVEGDPSADNYAQLAYFLYSDGQLEKGKEAADKAVAAASGAQKKQLQKGLDKLGDQAAKFEKERKKAAKSGATGETGPALQNPFGGLGSDSGAGGLAPASP